LNLSENEITANGIEHLAGALKENKVVYQFTITIFIFNYKDTYHIMSI
jgi:hypothetical protein